MTNQPAVIKVLLVEDNPGDVRLIREMLAPEENLQFALEHADRLATGLVRLASGDVDVLLLDLGLPDCVGFETFANVYAQAAHVPIIVLTDLRDEALAIRAVKEGAQDYLAKGDTDRRVLTRSIRYAIERKRLEQQYRALVDAAHDDILIVNQDGRLEFINNSGAERYDVPASQLVGRLIADFLPSDSSAEPLAAIKRVFETGEPIYQEFILAFARQDVWLGCWLVRLKGTASEPETVLVVGRDITEQKRLAQQLLQAQKMDAVGQLAGGVAHDFNNLLTTILGRTDLLLGTFTTDDRRREELTEVQLAALSAAALTRQLLAFSRNQILEHEVLDLNAVAGNLVRMVRRLIPENIEVITRLDPAVGRISADAVQIEQVLLNMALNARDAMPEGGTLTIETGNEALAEANVQNGPGATPASGVVLTVSDTGHGMDDRTQSHLFEPFFTTKEEGKGTGLGLATAYGIVRQSGGSISVSSELGRGTTFKVHLPRVEGDVAPRVPVISPGQPRPGTETVLVVEDAPKLRKLARTILEIYGYSVLDAKDGDEALRIALQHDGAIDLLLTDVVMPGMDGRALADRLTSLRPTTKVLFTSGHTNSAIFRSGKLDTGMAFLEKPYRPASLASKVREVLDSCRPG